MLRSSSILGLGGLTDFKLPLPPEHPYSENPKSDSRDAPKHAASGHLRFGAYGSSASTANFPSKKVVRKYQRIVHLQIKTTYMKRIPTNIQMAQTEWD